MTGQPKRQAFTLVELLVAMAVLAVIILMMARIFTGSTQAWDLGMTHAEQNITGRSLMDFIVREMSQALADGQISFGHEDNEGTTQIYGSNPDDVYFVSMNNSAQSGRRELREVIYYVEPMEDSDGNEIKGRYQLVREFRNDLQCFKEDRWWDVKWVLQPSGPVSKGVLAENVASFDVWCYRPDLQKESISDYNSNSNNYVLPTYADIALAVFDEKGADEAQMRIEDFNENENSTAMKNFVKENARRYVARVYFVNRNGYGPDK